MKKHLLGYVFVFISSIGFAMPSIFTRLISLNTTFSPLNIAILRFVFATPLIWLLLFRNKNGSFSKFHRKRFLGLGLVFTLASISGILSVQRIPVSLYIILLFTFPIWIVFYAFINKQAIPKLTWLGLPFAILGLFFTVYNPVKTNIDWIGVALALINGLVVAIYYLMSARFFAGDVSRSQGTMYLFLGALLSGLLTLPFSNFRFPNNGFEWMLFLGLTVLGTLVPITFGNLGIQLIGSTRSAMMNIFQPLAGIFMAHLIFDEALRTQQLIGAFLVICSIILLQTSKDTTPKTIIAGSE